MTKNLILICAGALQFYGCYYFTNPQPVNQPNINIMPTSLLGIWVENTDTTIIEQDRYYFKSEDYFKLSLDKKDEIKVIGETVYMLDFSEPNPVYTGKLISLTKDSVEGIAYSCEANLINHDFILRKVDTGFLLNSRYNQNWWNPVLIIQEDDTIRQYSLNHEKMKEIVDSTNIIFASQLTDELGKTEFGEGSGAAEFNDVYVNINWSLKEWNKMIANGIFQDDPMATKIRLKEDELNK